MNKFLAVLSGVAACLSLSCAKHEEASAPSAAASGFRSAVLSDLHCREYGVNAHQARFTGEVELPWEYCGTHAKASFVLYRIGSNLTLEVSLTDDGAEVIDCSQGPVTLYPRLIDSIYGVQEIEALHWKEWGEKFSTDDVAGFCGLDQ